LLAACNEKHLPESSLELASKGLYTAALANNGEWALAGSIFQGGSLWRVADGERLYNWNHTSSPEENILLFADIATNNTRAITADESTLVLWDINTGEASRFWTSPARILDIALMHNGQYVALGLADQSAVIFDAINGGITRTFRHNGKVLSVAVSKDQTQLLTGSEDRTAVLWRIEDSERLLTIDHQEEVQFVALSYDGRYALTAAQYDKAELWDTQNKVLLGSIAMKKQRLSLGLRITAANFSQDNALLLISYSNRTVELRDVNSLEIIDQWILPRRNQWQPTSTAALDLAFDQQDGVFHAISSDGFLHRLTLRSSLSSSLTSQPDKPDS
jgi:WD40 repeat protein